MAENVKPETENARQPRRRGMGITNRTFQYIPDIGDIGGVDIDTVLDNTPRHKVTDIKPKPQPLGVLLTLDEQYRLKEMADELGVSRHSLLVWWVREFMRKFEDEGYRPETKTTTTTVTSLVSNHSNHS